MTRQWPARYELGFNLSGNAMGEGTQANATIGRAIRLILRNVGGGHIGDGFEIVAEGSFQRSVAV